MFDSITNILALFTVITLFIVGILLLVSPFLVVRLILKKKFNWWIIIICLIISFCIFYLENIIKFKLIEYAFIKFSEGLLHTF
jgi:phosphoglycerol transferase MdoB-like AlkP superfamily enzyme